jgi:glycosyltransferase involved in cell wall biosynthesis
VRVEHVASRAGIAGYGVALAQRARTLRPDVIHAFKPIGPSGLAATLLWRSFPIVLDVDDWEGYGGFASAGTYSPAVAALIDAQERLTPRFAGAFTAASRTLAQRLVRRGAPRQQVSYLPNCVERDNLPEAAPTEEATAAFRRQVGAIDEPIVLYLGHVPASNDLDLAVEALTPLARKGKAFRWVVIGDGPGLERIDRALPASMKDRTRFAGRLPREALPAAFAASRLMLVPARDTPINRAKCAMKVVDSLAAGLPVVAPAVGQHREYVVDGVTGLLSPPGNARALRADVGRLLDNPALAKRLGAAAAERMRRGYTWDHWAGQAERAYRMAMA